MNILFVAVECFPFAKVGGLGDVIGSLPKSLAAHGDDVRVILPYYNTIKEELLKDVEEVKSFKVYLGKSVKDVRLLKKLLDGVTYYFIDIPEYFACGTVYNFPDEEKGYASFQYAVIEALQYMEGFNVDVINCHDWHTGMIPYILKKRYYREYGRIRTIFTIHNVIYQGEYDKQTVKSIFALENDASIQHNGMLNFMKAAIMNSTFVTTVSETYAKELLENPVWGHGMTEYLRQRDKEKCFFGIINGLDYNIWDPEKDPIIPVKYNFDNYRSAKLEAKKVLYQKLGVDFYTNVPLVGLVSRLTEQKGIDLIMPAMEELLEEYSFKFVVIGTGDSKYEEFFKELEKKHPFKVKAYIGYSDELAHLVYAASDMFLMPSLFEPCGLGQMIALKYGSLPIVRETGGLKDSVDPYNEFDLTGNGFSFTNYNSHDMLYVIKYAFRNFNAFNGYHWDILVYNAMHSDYSWDQSARKYHALYERALKK